MLRDSFMLALGGNASLAVGWVKLKAWRQECVSVLAEEQDRFGWRGVSKGKGSR